MFVTVLGCLAGCGGENPAPEATAGENFTSPHYGYTPDPESESETAATAGVPVPTETVKPTEALPEETSLDGSQFPHLRKVPFADQSIYSGPGYDFTFAGTVELAGTYTIVAEEWDGEGNLWGRLKSGAGWIDLTELRRREEIPVPISANYADDTLLRSGKFEHYLSPDSDYAVKIAFRANETLTDVSFFSMAFVGENYEKDKELRRMGSLTPDKPFVAEVEFPGDMSMYGISFTDEAGEARSFCVSISGRNGALILTEYFPKT